MKVGEIEKDSRSTPQFQCALPGFVLRIFLVALLLHPCVAATCFGEEPDQRASSSAGVNPNADAASPPFVAAFERFSRHNDLDKQASGELLISQLGCSACHKTSDAFLNAGKAPDLADVGHRLNRQWITEYLSNPHQVMPGTRMPDPLWMLDASMRADEVQAISVFLASKQKPVQLPRANGASPVLFEFWDKGVPEEGRQLYHSVGCVACHEPDPDFELDAPPTSALEQLLEQLEPEEIEELGLSQQLRPVPSVPAFKPGVNNRLGAKYTRQSLTLFLLNPHAVRPGGQMPSLRLSPSEAADLAAYLTLDQDAMSSLPDMTERDRDQSRELIKRGEIAFGKYGCVNCHTLQVSTGGTEAKPLMELNLNQDFSCISQPAGSMPDYRLDAEQISAVVSALEALKSAEKSEISETNQSEGDIVQDEMLRLNCIACHQRIFDGESVAWGGIGINRKPFFQTKAKVDIGDEGRFPPALTGVGAKLTSSSLKEIFSAKKAAHRPFMTIRMPAYHDDLVAELNRSLPIADKKDSRNETAVFEAAKEITKAELHRVGRELINTGCVECHVFREEQLPGAVGVDLHAIDKRLQPAWFRSFIENPGALKNRTRMPTFFPEGKSNRPDLLGGNVDHQIAAIWHYLKSSDPLPEKIVEAMSRDFELSPRVRPEVVRTFMKHAGTHAIAVGFPQQIHYAFDSETLRLSSLWRGRFLDARGTWFERFVPLTAPLGESRLELPAHPVFASGDGQAYPQSSLKFQGYRLDDAGVPTLLYQVAGWQIEDCIEPYREDGQATWSLHRRWKVVPGTDLEMEERADLRGSSNHHSPLQLILHEGTALETLASGAMRTPSGLVIRIHSQVNGNPLESKSITVSDKEDHERWMIEISADSEQTVEVSYQWD